jgi:hypothetical protein
MTTESNGGAAGGNDNAGQPDPNPMNRGQSLPDLSDIQAELDKTADEQPKKGSRAPAKEPEPEASESDDAETDDDADPFADDDEEDDGEGDGEEDDGESDESDDEEGDHNKPKKRSRNARYTDRIKHLEAEVSKLRSSTAAVSDEAIAAEVVKRIGAEPQETDFKGDYLAYEKEHTAWLLDKRQETRKVKAEAQEGAEAQRRQNVERVGAHKERLKEFGKSGAVKDFDKVMTAAKDAKVSPVVEDLILDSEKSGHLTFYFARNPGRLAAINAMNQRDAAREIGRIESRLSLPKPKVKTEAPKPKATRPGGGASASSQDAEIDSFLNKTYGKGRR